MKKEPKYIARLDVLDAICDTSGHDLFTSVASDTRSDDNLSDSLKLTGSKVLAFEILL
jgi:hypothetical protein